MRKLGMRIGIFVLLLLAVGITVIVLEDKKELKESEEGEMAIEWKNEALESAVRQYLGVTQGDILVNDLNKVENLIIYGSELVTHRNLVV